MDAADRRIGSVVADDGTAVADGIRQYDLQVRQDVRITHEDLIEQIACLGQQGAPVVVELQPLAHPVKQLQLQQAFQLVDGRAGGRL